MTELFDHGYYRISGSRYNKIKRLTGRARGGMEEDCHQFTRRTIFTNELHSSSTGILGDVFETTRATRRVGGGCTPAITIDFK